MQYSVSNRNRKVIYMEKKKKKKNYTDKVDSVISGLRKKIN